MRISDYFVPEHHIADVDFDDLPEPDEQEPEAWRDSVDMPEEPPWDWDWSAADEARVERALSELRRDLGQDDTEPF